MRRRSHQGPLDLHPAAVLASLTGPRPGSGAAARDAEREAREARVTALRRLARALAAHRRRRRAADAATSGT